MVFRKGTKISKSNRWYYGTNEIEIINEYKYLGIDLTYNLSFTKHLERKLSSAKIAINSTWLNYIHNTKINLSSKMKIFNTACKSIMFYGAQIYGFERYEQVEKLFRFFIKKILYLPSNTPNYMLLITETILGLEFLIDGFQRTYKFVPLLSKCKGFTFKDERFVLKVSKLFL
jgi:hypothetical protein